MGTGYPGKICTVACFFLMLSGPQILLGQGNNIEFPEPPKVVPPVQIDKKMMDEDLQKKKEQREEAMPTAVVEKKEPEFKKEELLAKESLAPRPLRYVFEASILYTFASVSGERKDYKSDPTSHFNFMYRFSNGPASETSGYAGFRLAPFAGSGKQKNFKGRFGFLYFGPSIGFGKIGAATKPQNESSRTAESASEASDARLGAPSRYGWLINTGLAAFSKTRSTKSELISEDEVGDDFKSQPLGFDSPGLWMEARFFYLKHNSFSIGPVLGLQTGEGKVLGYMGFTLAGWH